MLLSYLAAGLTTVALVTLPVVVGAQPSTLDPPTGDVWITPQSSYSFRPRSGVNTSPGWELRSGDVWLIPEDGGRNAVENEKSE
jgi:hypothetical protein